jgi:hypothetical protein
MVMRHVIDEKKKISLCDLFSNFLYPTPDWIGSDFKVSGLASKKRGNEQDRSILCIVFWSTAKEGIYDTR